MRQKALNSSTRGLFFDVEGARVGDQRFQHAHDVGVAALLSAGQGAREAAEIGEVRRGILDEGHAVGARMVSGRKAANSSKRLRKRRVPEILCRRSNCAWLVADRAQPCKPRVAALCCAAASICLDRRGKATTGAAPLTHRVIPVPPFDYVVFGGTGDLSRRKLLPALYHRFRDGQIVGGQPHHRGVAARACRTTNTARSTREALEKFLPDGGARRRRRSSGSSACSPTSRPTPRRDTGWDALAEMLRGGEDKVRAFYLAVGPDLIDEICAGIGRHELVTPQTRVVIEKPVGKDLASAQRVNEAVGAVFPEEQVFRIDHYLGKETVQNLMVLRFGNVLYEPLWNSAIIDHVQITVAETLGAESRGGYYDTAGALRDMVQNHMLQLLCLVAMEPPDSFDANAIRDEKLKILKALKPISRAQRRRRDGARPVPRRRGERRRGAAAIPRRSASRRAAGVGAVATYARCSGESIGRQACISTSRNSASAWWPPTPSTLIVPADRGGQLVGRAGAPRRVLGRLEALDGVADDRRRQQVRRLSPSGACHEPATRRVAC